MRIGEVAEQTGLSISNIRFYEKKNLIEPVRNKESQYREYTEDDIARLKEIILYRKLNLPIETIYELINKNISLEHVLKKQQEELKSQMDMLQGSMDLCEKMLEEKEHQTLDVDYYLNYVKEEEAKGVRFAQVEELLEDFAEFTQFDSYMNGRYMANAKVRYTILLLWFIFFAVLPIICTIDSFIDGEALSLRLVLFWAASIIIFVVSFIQFRKGKKIREVL